MTEALIHFVLPVVCSDLPSVRNLIPSGHTGVIFIPPGDHKKCNKEMFR